MGIFFKWHSPLLFKNCVPKPYCLDAKFMLPKCLPALLTSSFYVSQIGIWNVSCRNY